MHENTVAVRILRMGQQISPPPSFRSAWLRPCLRIVETSPGYAPAVQCRSQAEAEEAARASSDSGAGKQKCMKTQWP